MKFQITRGLIVKPQKVVVYGPEGIGKTTLPLIFRIRCLSIPKAVRMSTMLPDYRRRLLGRCCWMRLERLSKIQPAVKHWLLIRLTGQNSFAWVMYVLKMEKMGSRILVMAVAIFL